MCQRESFTSADLLSVDIRCLLVFVFVSMFVSMSMSMFISVSSLAVAAPSLLFICVVLKSGNKNVRENEYENENERENGRERYSGGEKASDRKRVVICTCCSLIRPGTLLH